VPKAPLFRPFRPLQAYLRLAAELWSNLVYGLIGRPPCWHGFVFVDLDSVFELHILNDLGQMVDSTKPPPALFSVPAQLVNHCVRLTSFP